MTTIGYVTNSSVRSGVGHRADMIARHLEKNREISLLHFHIDRSQLFFEDKVLETVQPWPGMLGSKTFQWIRLGRKLAKHAQNVDIMHATNQTLSFIPVVNKPRIVTVHDIIEMLEPQDKRTYYLNKYLYSGIPRADHIIAVSQFTKESVIEAYGISPNSITVVPNGVDSQVFYPIESFTETIGYQTLIRDLRLSDAHPIVLFVGSDHPRKQGILAARAFARLQQERSDAVFIKVGEAGLPEGRKLLLEEIDRLGIAASVRFVGSVTNERLNELYNLADVLLFPSRFEGFGLPPLQAMAAGTPVVTSNTSSLPEVIADAGIMHAPDDVAAFVKSLSAITGDRALAKQYREKGLQRSRQFTWETAAAQEAMVYSKYVS